MSVPPEPAPSSAPEPASTPSSPIIRILGTILVVCVVGEVSIAALTAFHAPQDWQIVNKATIG